MLLIWRLFLLIKITSDVHNENIAKKTKYKRLTSKLDDLEDKIPDESTLPNINQCKADRKIENIDKFPRIT